MPLRIPAAAVARWRTALEACQRQQVQRLRHSRHRLRAAAAHAALRSLLARSLGCQARDLRLVRDPGGKPRIDIPVTGRRLHFNLSHSGDHALVALAWDCPVGVDLEVLDPGVPLDDLLPVFTPPEQAGLAAAPLADRRWHAWRCWVRKEAVLKAVGCGLAGGLDRLTVSTGDAARIESTTLPGLDPARWQLVPLDAPGRWAAALAWEGEAAMPLRREWRWETG